MAVVVNTIPSEALTRGVWTEKNLKIRFDRVAKVCKQVARIDANGGTLYQNFISRLQSYFMLTSPTMLAHSDEVDADTLDTYQIIAHAKHFIQQGDLEQALRFMTQLKGMPASVAADWVQETQLLLEARQAARALSAYSSSQGLGSIF